VSQVNLLPPEIRQRAKVRQRTAVVAVIGVAVLLLIAFYLLQTMELSRVEEDLAAQQQTNSQLQTEIAALSRFGDLQAELQEKEELLSAVYVNEIAWSGVLVDVSRVIPDDAVLIDLSGQTGGGGEVAGAVPAVPTETGAGPIGTVSFTGRASETETLALWLSNLARVKGWENPFVSTLAETEDRSRIYDFTSTVDLFSEVLTRRGRGMEEAA
jgi:Tfp pilus assembly protein PilN